MSIKFTNIIVNITFIILLYVYMIFSIKNTVRRQNQITNFLNNMG